MQNRILVTGVTSSFGGKDLVKQLSSIGVRFRAGIHTPYKIKKLNDNISDILEVDFSKPETLKQAFSGIERLFLLIPFTENMVEMTANAVEQAIDSGIKHIVYESVINADKERNKMTKLHRKSENLIINSDIPYTILRPNFLMQNFSETGTIKKSNSISILSDKGKISFIDVRDVAAVAAEALTKENHYDKAYDLTGAEALSVDQIVDIFSRMLNRQIIATKFSESEVRKLLIAAGFSAWYLDILPEIAEAQEKGFMSIVSNDVEKVIGRKPISFTNFVKDYINIF